MDPLLRCLEGYAQMHIAMIAPPWFPIPPRHGGIEQVVYNLVEGLVEAGHQVTLFAPAGSKTSAALIPVSKSPTAWIATKRKTTISETACRRAFFLATSIGADIIHDHTDYIYRRNSPIPIVRTIHGPVTDCALDRYLAMTRQETSSLLSAGGTELSTRPRLTVSEPVERSHSRRSSTTRSMSCIPPFTRCTAGGLCGLCGAVPLGEGTCRGDNCRRSGRIPLKMALRVTVPERPYFEDQTPPGDALRLDRICWRDWRRERSDLYGKARALVFSSTWEEPFGLSIIESLAHGTPVVAFRRGSAPEIIVEGDRSALRGHRRYGPRPATSDDPRSGRLPLGYAGPVRRETVTPNTSSSISASSSNRNLKSPGNRLQPEHWQYPVTAPLPPLTRSAAPAPEYALM